MRKFVFNKEKYGFPLLMDLHRLEGNPNLYFDSKPHITDFFEIIIFEKSNGIIELNGHILDIENNSFFFVCPFQKKSCKISLSDIKGFHLVFKNDFLADFFDDKLFAYRLQYFYNAQHPQYLKLQNSDYVTIQTVLNEVVNDIENFQNDSPHILRSLLYFLLSKLNRLYSKHYNVSDNTLSNSIIYRFKELLEKHIRNLHAVDEYCNLLRVKRNKLNVVTKEHTGCTSKEFIDNRLHQEIKMELYYSDKTIAEIAHALNFSDPNNLTRFFKKKEGVSPSAYRKKHQIDRK
ncbi:AraC family transcriptional regulator [Tenacibaculum sp. SDUM215027]|uniref:AraC family transcriptional regulator n=1 Tax=Tenacibaculum sp. SDUM215027 TaxID=3422596 RepID=UPI003D3151B8